MTSAPKVTLSYVRPRPLSGLRSRSGPVPHGLTRGQRYRAGGGGLPRSADQVTARKQVTQAWSAMQTGPTHDQGTRTVATEPAGGALPVVRKWHKLGLGTQNCDLAVHGALSGGHTQTELGGGGQQRELQQEGWAFGGQGSETGPWTGAPRWALGPPQLSAQRPPADPAGMGRGTNGVREGLKDDEQSKLFRSRRRRPAPCNRGGPWLLEQSSSAS